MSLIEKELPGVIKNIWSDYHSTRSQNVSTVISSTQYTILSKRLSLCPIFIFPVKRESGYFFLLSQSQGKSNLFTFLEDYKKNPDHAVPYLVITLFDELLISKGLVLVRGDIIDQLITKNEASVLLKAFLGYYVETGLYEDNVHKFNHQPLSFNHEKHVENYFSRFIK